MSLLKEDQYSIWRLKHCGGARMSTTSFPLHSSTNGLCTLRWCLILHHLRTSVYPNTFTSLPTQNASFSQQFSFLRPKSLTRKIISQDAVLTRSTDDPHGVHFPRRHSITSDACHGRNSTAVFIHAWNAYLRFHVSAFYNFLIIYLSFDIFVYTFQLLNSNPTQIGYIPRPLRIRNHLHCLGATQRRDQSKRNSLRWNREIRLGNRWLVVVAPWLYLWAWPLLLLWSSSPGAKDSEGCH